MNKVSPKPSLRETNKELLGNSLFVNSLAKGLSVLTAFAAAGQDMGIAEIAKVAELDRSATQRCVFTLFSLGYLRQNSKSKRYSLAPRVLDLAAAFFSSDTLRKTSLPFLEALAGETEETVNLSELDGHDIVYVARFPSRHVVSVDLSLGTRLPAWCTAPGRAILAHLEPPAVAAILGHHPRVKRTPNTITDEKQLLQILAETRESGFALADQEAFVGDISIASPVFGVTGVAGAINIAVPFPRWTIERVRSHLAPMVVRTAVRISEAMGSGASRPPPRGPLKKSDASADEA